MLSEREIRKSKTYENIFKNSNNKFISLVNQHSFMALRPEIRAQKSESDSIKVMGTLHDEKDEKQLWMFKPIKHNKFEIVNFFTDLVLTSDNGFAILEKGKQKSSQTFDIEKNKTKNLVRIKDHESCYLFLEGVLAVGKFNEHDETQMFQAFVLEDEDKIQNLSHVFLIVEPIKKEKCLDLSRGSTAVGASIGLWAINLRSNQRWIFNPLLTDKDEKLQYSIQNHLSKMYMDVNSDMQLTQNNCEKKIWEIRRKHGYSGQLFCTQINRYLNKDEEDKLIMTKQMGWKWEMI